MGAVDRRVPEEQMRLVARPGAQLPPRRGGGVGRERRGQRRADFGEGRAQPLEPFDDGALVDRPGHRDHSSPA
jgi:hypothetical protein